MYALLVLDEKGGHARVLVKLKTKASQNRVHALLGKNKGREAFDLLKEKAEVEAFLRPGAKLPFVPPVTIIEDLI